MVTEQVAGLHAATHGHARATGVVVLAHRAAVVALIGVAHADRGRRAEGSLDALAIAVVYERGHSRAADRHQPVLGVVAVGGSACPAPSWCIADLSCANASRSVSDHALAFSQLVTCEFRGVLQH